MTGNAGRRHRLESEAQGDHQHAGASGRHMGQADEDQDYMYSYVPISALGEAAMRGSSYCNELFGS